MATVVFGAKESAYKCQYRLSRAWLGFEEVAVKVGDGTFEVSIFKEALCSRLGRHSLMGRFARDEEFIVCGVTVTDS